MNDLDSLLKEIKDEIYSNPLVVEYFRLKNLIDNDSELKSLDEKVKLHQHAMCKNISNDEVYLKEKSEYEKYLHEFDDNPLIINFKKIKEELTSYLEEIKEAIQ